MTDDDPRYAFATIGRCKHCGRPLLADPAKHIVYHQHPTCPQFVEAVKGHATHVEDVEIRLVAPADPDGEN